MGNLSQWLDDIRKSKVVIEGVEDLGVDKLAKLLTAACIHFQLRRIIPVFKKLTICLFSAICAVAIYGLIVQMQLDQWLLLLGLAVGLFVLLHIAEFVAIQISVRSHRDISSCLSIECSLEELPNWVVHMPRLCNCGDVAAAINETAVQKWVMIIYGNRVVCFSQDTVESFSDDEAFDAYMTLMISTLQRGARRIVR